jgi:type I restriction enzyme S subunit
VAEVMTHTSEATPHPGYKMTEIGEIPVEWETKRLSDVAIVAESHAILSDTYVSFENIQSGTGFLLNTDEAISYKTKVPFVKGHILLGRIRPYLNKVWLAAMDGFCSTDIIRIEPVNTNATYLKYLLLSQKFVDYAVSASIGTKMPRATWNSLRRFSFACPPLPEQRKIASILSEVDDNIQKTQQVIEKTEELKRGLMQQLLTRGIGRTRFKQTEIGEIPEEWEVARIGAICRVRRGASPRPISDSSYFADSGRGWVRIEDVTSTYKYLRRTVQCLSPKGASRSVSVNPGDLIMSICATIGKPVIVDMEACIHDGFVWFSNLSPQIDRDFLYYILQYKEKYIAGQRQTGTQGNLNTGIVGKVLIPKPPVDEQIRISKMLSAADERIEKEKKHKKNLEQLKKGLMQVLLTGKVRMKVDEDG